MKPIELRSRREALGLSQRDLAKQLGNAQNTVSQWEAGKRLIPQDVERVLATLEKQVSLMIEQALSVLESNDADPIVLITHATDASLWAAHPEMDGTPAVIHRVACARIAAEIHAEDKTLDVHIITAATRGEFQTQA